MSHGILTLHLTALTFWLGVVGAEFVIERSRSASRPHGFAVAANHFWIDVLLEIPAVLVVLATGALLLRDAPMTGLLAVKVAAGLIALLSNLACFWPVTRRHRAAARQELAAVIRHSKAIDRISMVAIPAALLAWGLGLAGLR